MVWHTGKKLNGGQYTVERVLGQGGFGITYLAKNTNNEKVAIKTLNDEAQSRPDFIKLQEDLIEETKRLQKCVHPHIVKIYDLFLEQNLLLGLIQKNILPCLVMEYIPGKIYLVLCKNEAFYQKPKH
jgi:eukaryotic-like serine/threonine-protein kinase